MHEAASRSNIVTECLYLQCDERVLQEAAVGFTDVGTGKLRAPRMLFPAHARCVPTDPSTLCYLPEHKVWSVC